MGNGWWGSSLEQDNKKSLSSGNSEQKEKAQRIPDWFCTTYLLRILTVQTEHSIDRSHSSILTTASPGLAHHLTLDSVVRLHYQPLATHLSLFSLLPSCMPATSYESALAAVALQAQTYPWAFCRSEGFWKLDIINMSRAFQWLLDPFSVPAESEVGGVRIQILSLPFLPSQTPEHSLALRGKPRGFTSDCHSLGDQCY